MLRKALCKFRRKMGLSPRERELAEASKEFYEARDRVNAIRKLRAKQIKATGTSTSHLERSLSEAIKTKAKRLRNWRTILEED